MKGIQKYSPAWYHTPAFPALWKLKQEGGEFEASLGYIVRFYLKEREEEWGKNAGSRNLQMSKGGKAEMFSVPVT